MKYTTGKVAKAWSWSYSKLKNYRTCPFRYLKIDVEKKYQDDFNSPALKDGKRTHKAFEDRVKHNTPFPADLAIHEDAIQRILASPGTLLVEQQMAIRKDLSPCGWFDHDVWFRSQADLIKINGPVALALDYKTGKIVEDAEQLALVAECVFSHFPSIHAVRTEFWWLKEDAATREDFRRANRKDTWRKILPEVMTLEQAHQTMAFPQRSSGLCKNHCIVKECPHHGGNK